MRNTTYKTVIGAALALAVSAAVIAGTGTAAADQSEYQQRLREELPFVVAKYGLPTLLAEGVAICTDESNGITDASDLADRTVYRLPMSRSSAISLQVYAEHYLGC